MELCFYNAAITDLSKRAEWFTCACCPPNVTRLLGYVGGYIWSCQGDEEKSSAQINVHLYTSAKVSVPVGSKVVELEQKSEWPWNGKVEFTLSNSLDVSTTIKLRIPGWAPGWEVRRPDTR
jgi:DUF1680 family protein